MQFRELALPGVFLVTLDVRHDGRGFFSRLFCVSEFSSNGLDMEISQINNSLSRTAGTLRGLHYQVAPHGEAKLIRCIRGSIYDVVVDLRQSSPTFGKCAGEILRASTREMMFVPKGCAHGFLTLEPDTELIYGASSPYVNEAERILRWNDPTFSIDWPASPVVISDKDKSAPNYSPELHCSEY